jgi:hypothetical protein
MISHSIICSNPHFTTNWSWKLFVTSFQIHIALKNWSWRHPISSVPIHIWPHISSHILSSITCSSTYITSNSPWRIPVTSFWIHIALQMKWWEHSIKSVPIQKAPQYRSWPHTLSSVKIHIVLQIGLIIFLTYNCQSRFHLKLGHESILSHLFQ